MSLKRPIRTRNEFHVIRKKRMTQVEMARKLGISLKAYGSKEGGEREFLLSEAKLAGEILGLTLDETYQTLSNWNY